MSWIDAILFGDLIFIGFCALLWVAGYLTEKYVNWKNPVYPHCNIDPRCHPDYHDGWIGNIRVNR